MVQPVSAYAEGSITTQTQFVVETGTSNAVKTTSSAAEKDAVIIGDTRVSIAIGDAATAGLPQTTVETISAINSAKTPLAEVVKDVDVTGYSALTAVSAIVVKDASTQEVKTGNVVVDLYVPNIIEGIGTVEILFYNNATGKWELIKPVKIDYATKQISAAISGSGSFSVVYKK